MIGIILALALAAFIVGIYAAGLLVFMAACSGIMYLCGYREWWQEK